MNTLVDSGLLIAALNRGDQHHSWAVAELIGARERRRPLLVPEVVVGETFTKMRYDRRVSARRDAGAALAVFRLVDENPDVFQRLSSPPDAYSRAAALLAMYRDQSFSFVDAVVFLSGDDD
ncbi:MAG: type II toxin-antitoxin system VapC family toxin, partial [Candidatus Dormibacteria bacterium]